MNSQFYSSLGNHGYAPLWNKYRPAILQLMLAASNGPQEYKLFKHEFKTLNPKEKGFGFTLEAFQGKAVNDIRKSNVAKDLLEVLGVSPKARELMDTDTYAFSLDKQFVLHVSKKENEIEEEVEAVKDSTQSDD